MGATTASVLYISYDGVLEPLGDSQVVSYIERLASDVPISLLSYEKPADLLDTARVAAMEQRLAARRIRWIRLRYSKRPPLLSTAWDVLRGILRARRECRARSVRVIHARSYVSSLIALGARSASGARYLFDMRGFWVDEKIEAGHWRRGSAIVRLGKFWERRFFREADAIVSLTEAGVRTFAELGYHVAPSVPIAVIPTCVDVQRFVPAPKDPALMASLGLDGALVVGCAGTVSNWYMRHEMLAYLALLARSLPNVRVLFVTREDHAALGRDAATAGIPAAQLVLTSTSFADMPRYTSLFDAAVFFIRPALSKRGSAATKLAEFLACGVPVVINDGVGDSGSIVESHRVGVVLGALDEATQQESLARVRALLADREVADRCRQTALALFDIEAGVFKYRDLYRRLSAVPHGDARDFTP